ncbi:Disease resistance protein RPP13 [Abeliophyllum distichum]|uniref:Disease resistance protein RPP13 n=1 Tax=Abeliophyllum distichum TaxID=126358 RepID=A0ABD1V6D3_9LAMI
MTESGREMAPSIYNLRRLLKYRSKSEMLEMFDGQGQLVLIVAQFMIKLCSEDDPVIVLLKRLDHSAKLSWGYTHYNEEDRKLSIFFRSFMEELQVFFKVPNSMSTLSPKELVAAFIDFLLEIFEEILNLQLYFIHHVEDSIQSLKMELKFLLIFLGDTPSQPTELETTKKILADIEVVANETGSFLYSFFFSTNRISVTGMKQTLSDLLGNVELLKENIKKHCITVAKILPSGVTRQTSVFSLSLVDSILDYLKDLMNNKDVRIFDLKDQIETIHQELMFLQSFLTNIEVEKYPQLEEFFIRIRVVAYEVEYIINSFAPVWYLTLRIPQVMEKIQLVSTQFREKKKMYDAGLQKKAEYLSQQLSLQALRPHIGDGNIIGLEDVKLKIKEYLVGGPSNLQIISIFGMPGLGKTTLAKNIYHDAFIRHYFDICSWCVVSQTYQKRNMLIDILMSISDIGRDIILNIEDEILAEWIYIILEGRRYIIFMDGIWNVTAWFDIRLCIPNENCGSRILFTSQIAKVDMDTLSRSFNSPPRFFNYPPRFFKHPRFFNYPLRFLTHYECWNLLQFKVFDYEQCPPVLVDVAKKIARNCGGLPSTVVFIASVLKKLEKEKSLWMDVAENITSYISKDTNDYMNMLELSYNHLPMHLKPCFLYFGAFEKDKEIPVQKLIMLWAAEGFIQKAENRSSEDVAEQYLLDLINRSMVLVAKRKSDGRIKACSVHGAMHDICLRVAEKENFMKVMKDQLSIYEEHHRLSIQSRSTPSFSRPFGLHVRSLLGHLPDPSAFIFSSLKLLKVLDLSNTDMSLYNLTGSEALAVLRFLSISSIPSLIKSFENLEFLFVDNKEVVEIPAIFLNMVKLRHVHFSGGAQFNESLRIQETQDENFLLNNLQYLSSIFINDENDEKILRFLPRIRTLKCRITLFWDSSENCYRYPAFGFLNHLESLSVSFRPSYVSDDISREVIDLQRNLRKLTLRNFDLSWKQMNIIGMLPELQVLKLRDDTIEGKKWDTGEDEFQQLRYLELDVLQIEHWNVSYSHFPRLERLVLRSCQNFEIPVNLVYIQTVEKIEVHGCAESVEVSALQIQEGRRALWGHEYLKVIISH